jgi:NAD(P)-dependent dehydrogenase (short-subunit alcohol dehydrogenase family)
MESKVALVTGGTAGIGRAAAVAFARRGARVVVCGRREAEGEQTMQLVRAAGGDGFFVQADVSDELAVQQLIQTIVERYDRLDYAFNNAGVGGIPGPMADGTRENWDYVIGVNLTGTWLCMKSEIQQMLRQGHGAIVNMASVGGVWGTPGISSYVAAKHGIVGLTKTAAYEYAPFGIRINVVGPGGIHTEMLDIILPTPEIRQKFSQFHPVKRLGQPEEVANTVVWLCSDEASFITGATIMVDGGVSSSVNPFA